MKILFQFVLLVFLLANFTTLRAADSPFQANEISVTTSYVADTRDFKEFDEGVATTATYFFTDTFGVGASAFAYAPEGQWWRSASDVTIDEVSIDAIARQPLGSWPLAIFGTLGAGNHFEEHEWRLNAGAGVEARWKALHVQARGEWVNDFDGDAGKARLYGSLGFHF